MSSFMVLILVGVYKMCPKTCGKQADGRLYARYIEIIPAVFKEVNLYPTLNESDSCQKNGVHLTGSLHGRKL